MTARASSCSSGVRAVSWLTTLLLPACFAPIPRGDLACSANRECPEGLHCSAQLICESAVADASLPDTPSNDSQQVCWTIAATNLSACALVTVGIIDVTQNMSINTDTGESTPPGLRCAPLVSSSDDFCALVAGTISLQPQRTLSAHGSKSLALLANALDIHGTVDVSSHTGSALRGAGAAPIGCNPASPATGGGGGGGGSFGGAGGPGGNQGGTTNTRGLQGGSISTNFFRGGCDGGRGGDGSAAGGSSGGSVWLSATTTLTLAATGTINASGAGGGGGAPGDRGGGGGGSGGMIVLQALTIVLDPAAQIFANGGHGGGGSQRANPGEPGTDPINPLSGGGGGAGGLTPAGRGFGDGGSGYPNAPFNGRDGDAAGGGGGGGGGGGVIRISSPTTISDTPNISPPPRSLLP